MLEIKLGTAQQEKLRLQASTFRIWNLEGERVVTASADSLSSIHSSQLWLIGRGVPG